MTVGTDKTPSSDTWATNLSNLPARRDNKHFGATLIYGQWLRAQLMRTDLEGISSEE